MTSKIALITGGSRGLGRSAALSLAANGIDSIITYLSNNEAAAEVSEAALQLGATSVAIQLDTADAASFPRFVKQLQTTLQTHWQKDSLDYLVNNAGTGINVPFADTSEAQLDSLYRIHLKGPYLLTQALLPVISDGGRVLNVSSGLTRFSRPGMSAYAMMKGAVEVMTRYQAVELGGRGITVNTLAPGAIETDFAGGVLRDNPDYNEAIRSQTVLGRTGKPDDIGELISALLSDATYWVNGQRIEATGGFNL